MDPPIKTPESQHESPAPSLTSGLTILFLLASFNFLFGKLEGFSCETKELLAHSPWVRHTFAVSGLFAVLVIFTRAHPVLAPHLLVLAAFGLYAVFLAACRCDAKFLAFVLVAVVAVLYLEAERCWLRSGHDQPTATTSPEQKAELDRKIERAQTAIGLAALAAVTIGCVIYIGQHAREYRGAKWSWAKFWLGMPACKGNSSPCDKRLGCSIAGDFGDGVRRILGMH